MQQAFLLGREKATKRKITVKNVDLPAVTQSSLTCTTLTVICETADLEISKLCVLTVRGFYKRLESNGVKEI